MGSGGPRGLQNRSGLTTSGWVGSIPTRSRHPSHRAAVGTASPLCAEEYLPPVSHCQRNLEGPHGSHPPMRTHLSYFLHELLRATRCGVPHGLIGTGLLAFGALTPATVDGQQRDSVRAGIQLPARALPAVVTADPSGAAGPVPADPLGPPITPRRAFLYSLLVPGSGQAKLDRAYAGGLFFLVEVSALVLVHRSAEDYRIARRFSGDSIPLRFNLDASTGSPIRDANGSPEVAAWSVPRYDEEYVRTRRLHYEDWLAVMVFNHLFAGADAFVAAQLWDLPTKVAVRPTPRGPAVQVSLSFR